MNGSLCGAIGIQIFLVIWLLSGIRLRGKEEYQFFDSESTAALKGYFSIVIVLFHVPVSGVIYNLYGCALAVVIVTLFSYFSVYGMTVKARMDETYVRTIPRRFVRIAILYSVTLLLKYLVTGNMASGGIFWINSLLLSYVVFYLTYTMIRGGGIRDGIIIGFWLAYSVMMKWCPNQYFSWPAQSLGFAYGTIAAVYHVPLQRFFGRRIKGIIAACLLILPVLAGVYLKIHTPERETMLMFFLRIAISFLLILLFLALSVRIRLISKTMTYIGKISIYIYLLHGMVIDILKDHLADGWLILASIVFTVFFASCLSFALKFFGRKVKPVIGHLLDFGKQS